MKYSELDIFKILEVLAIIANGMAVIINLILSSTVLYKSIIAKKSGIKVSSEEFASHDNLFTISKSCGRCGFIFQFLAWLMFSSKKAGIAAPAVLTYYFALFWAITCVVTFCIGAAARFLNGKEASDAMLKRKTTWMMIYSILYFVITFLIH